MRSSTRLTALVTFVLTSTGLVVISSQTKIWMLAIGSFLIAGGTLLFARHLWRESNRKRADLSTAGTRSIAREVTRVDKSTENASTAVRNEIEKMSSRFDVLTQGMLEYTAQLEIQVDSLQHRVVELSGQVANINKPLMQLTAKSDANVSQLTQNIEEAERRATKGREKLLSQASGVVSLYSTLKPAIPYPQFGGWAISGDCALRLVNLTLSIRPSWVLETGSGLSTLLLAHALDLLDEEGGVISLEHDDRWLEDTASMLRDHGLSHRVNLVHAPLVDTSIGDEVFKWYDLTRTEIPAEIEIVFVDGPPQGTGPRARYPALPMLFAHLPVNGVLLMDDADRSDERAAIERWSDEYPGLEIKFHPDSKGTVEVIKRSNGQ
jgi:predicted O-methyltransferase YrrM